MSGYPNAATAAMLGSPRPDLMKIVEEISFDELNLANEKILPTLAVAEDMDAYPVMPRGNHMRIPDTKRAPDGSYNRGKWDWGSASYTTVDYGFEQEIDVIRAMQIAKYMDEEEVASQLCVEGLKLARESRVATAVYNPTTFAGVSLGTAAPTGFDTATTCTGALTVPLSTPATASLLNAVEQAFFILRAKAPLEQKAYSLVMSDDLVRLALRLAEVVNSTMYVSPVALMPIDQKRGFLADFLGVKEIVPISALYDTSMLGAEASKIGKFWSNDYILMAKLSTGSSAGFRERCLGRQLRWSGFPGNDYFLETYDEPTRKKHVVRALEYRGIWLNTDYGFLITGAKAGVNAVTGI